MKASEFLKRYEQKQKEKQDKRSGQGEDEQGNREPGNREDHSLQEQAKERAKHPDHLNVGTPFDWEELEAYQKELDRLDREGPGKDKANKPSKPDNSGKLPRK